MSEGDDGMEHGVLTEPTPIPCLLVSGWDIEIIGGTVRLIGWVELPYIGGQTKERRIIARHAMTDEAGRLLMSRLRKKLARGGH
ncbi:hypothetical protein [Taklimakanibacter deserti]|uniref:hypothetical protein n=1 Tax=Taklimakanibacter deserti TaxID=2267839 RepID=UPI000E647021